MPKWKTEFAFLGGYITKLIRATFFSCSFVIKRHNLEGCYFSVLWPFYLLFQFQPSRWDRFSCASHAFSGVRHCNVFCQTSNVGNYSFVFKKKLQMMRLGLPSSDQHETDVSCEYRIDIPCGCDLKSKHICRGGFAEFAEV